MKGGHKVLVVADQWGEGAGLEARAALTLPSVPTPGTAHTSKYGIVQFQNEP